MKESIKERFSITLDEELINWIESLIKDRTFSNRVHAVEFCVSEIKKIGIGNIMAMRWGKIEPFWVSETEVKTIERISKKFNIDKKEALTLLIGRGFEEISKDSNELDRETKINGMKKEEKEDEYIGEVIFD